MSFSSLISWAAHCALQAVGEAPRAAPLRVTPSHLGALGKVLAGFPVGDILALLSNHATVDSNLDLADKAAGLTAAAFPPGALIAGEAQMALDALKYLLDAAGLGSTPVHVTGGDPTWRPPGGGPGSFRGR